MEKNYYDILGVSKTATPDEIKKAYRKLAMKYHPDKYTNKSEAEKKEAENKMREINEANDILSDETKRKEYDNPKTANPFEGMGGGNPFGGFGFDDIFGSMFGGRTKQVRKGSNIRINLNVTIDDILTKTTKKVKYKIRSGANGRTCPHCGGTGTIMHERGGLQAFTTCPYCGGAGVEMKEIDHECEFTINGVDASNDVNFDEANNIVSFVQVIKGEGNTISDKRSQNGDLVVIIRFSIPKGFKLTTPTDVAFELEVPILTALLGGEIEVKSLTGTILKAKIPQGITDGTNIRFNGKGLQSNGKFGNMFGQVKLKLPKSLTNNEKEILSQLKNSPNFR